MAVITNVECYNKIYEFENKFSNKEFILPVGKVCQVAELSIVPKGIISNHIQVCDEITYAISGRATVVCDGKAQEIKSGQVHFIKKGISHEIIADDNESFRYICIGFNLNKECGDVSEFVKADLPQSLFVEGNSDIRYLTKALLNEFYLNDSSSKGMINACLVQIFVNLCRIYKQSKGKKDQKREGSYNTSKFTLYSILRYIDKEYADIKSVKQISEYIKYNEDYVSHLFKEKMGVSLKEYLTRKKITEASEMLVSTTLRIEEISEYLNFNSAHSFYQAFKRINKISPLEYRKRNSGI